MSTLTPTGVAIRRALAMSVATAAILVGGAPAFAQDADSADELSEVVVTGTRIRTPGLTSNSPIASVTAEDIDRTQPVSVEEFFKTLPVAIPAIGSGTNNGSNGRASIDLRGLGANRNIVLIDGRRMVPADLDGRTDTNAIPLALIEPVAGLIWPGTRLLIATGVVVPEPWIAPLVDDSENLPMSRASWRSSSTLV